jgi:hypothetical protein
MNIISWNILLRDHEIKYNPSSEILLEWPVESYREDAIINILKLYSNKDSIILLQEVSLSILFKLTHAFEDKSIFSYRISKNEYLVTLSPRIYTEESWTQNKTANGYLAIKKDDLLIVNTHLIPQRYVMYDVLDYILKIRPKNIGSTTMIVGDFNENWKKINNVLGSRYIVPFFGSTYKKRQIDHIIFDKNLKISSKQNIAYKNISDHNLLKLIIDE